MEKGMEHLPIVREDGYVDPTAELRSHVRELYFGHHYKSLPQLASSFNISINTLKEWVFRGTGGGIKYPAEQPWSKERNRLEDEARKEAAKVAANDLADTLRRSSTMMGQVLDRIQQGIDNGAFETKDLPDLFTKLATPMKSLHAVLRLETGQSTERKEVNSTSLNISNIADAMKALKNDPFSTIEIEVVDEQ